MALGEFELIRKFFTRPPKRQDVRLGVGDDCALLAPPSGRQIALTVDTLVAGVHFLEDTDPERLGHKCLAVNLSDLAAMGAEPAWMTLALTLPESDESWLESFSSGFMGLAERHGVELVGGDTTQGPLSITVQAMGLVEEGGELKRSGARPGDGIYLTGNLGLPGLGLEILLGKTAMEAPAAVAKLERPQPRIEAGMRLVGWANACIDVSDGLAADLGHILKASGVGAMLDWDDLPLPVEVIRYLKEGGDEWMPLYSGDEYELCFTVSPEREAELAGRLAGCPCTRIGRIEEELGLRLLKDGKVFGLTPTGYQHFPGSI